jgi:2,4-diketo-3-deoxy-L-fuconate hydrolase
LKLVSYGPAGSELPGVLVEESRIVPLASLLRGLGAAADMTAAVALLPVLEPRLEALADGATLDAGSSRLGPPVPRPSKVVVCGVNYQPPAGIPPPRRPPIALRPPTSLAGPRDPIVHPHEVRELDYEAELAVVIGRAGRRIARTDAAAHVAGYMCAQDLGGRDIFRGDTDLDPTYLQIARGKSFDTFCPTGPWLVTPDELPDAGDLRIRCWVNGEPRQDASTRELLVDVPGLVEWASSSMTLLPGDIVLTGTPAGCGIDFEPPRYLKPGDVVRTTIEGLGEMENPVVDESEDT